MEWFVLMVVYIVIGIAVFAWTVRGNQTLHADQKRRSARMLILFPELCLFWPVALLTEIKRRKAASQAASNHPGENKDSI